MVCLEAPLNTERRVVRVGSTDGVCEVPLSIGSTLATYSAVLPFCSLVWKVLASLPFQGVIMVMVRRCCSCWQFLAQGNCQLTVELHLRELPSVASVPGVKHVGIIHHHLQHPKEHLPPPLDGLPSKTVIRCHLIHPVYPPQVLVVIMDEGWLSLGWSAGPSAEVTISCSCSLKSSYLCILSLCILICMIFVHTVTEKSPDVLQVQIFPPTFTNTLTGQGTYSIRVCACTSDIWCIVYPHT